MNDVPGDPAPTLIHGRASRARRGLWADLGLQPAWLLHRVPALSRLLRRKNGASQVTERLKKLARHHLVGKHLWTPAELRAQQAPVETGAGVLLAAGRDVLVACDVGDGVV